MRRCGARRWRWSRSRPAQVARRSRPGDGVRTVQFIAPAPTGGERRADGLHMTGLPDFAAMPWRRPELTSLRTDTEPWLTPEGIAVSPIATAEDTVGLDFLNSVPGLPPYVRGPYPTMY